MADFFIFSVFFFVNSDLFPKFVGLNGRKYLAETDWEQ